LNYFGEKKQSSHRFCSLIFFSAAQSGIKDSLTPYIFLAFLMLNVLLYVFRKWPKQFSFFSLSFILGYLIIHTRLVVGAFDSFLNTPVLQHIVHWTNLVLAMSFVGIGAIHFRDWLMIKKGREADIFISLDRGNESSPKALGRIKTIGCGIVIFMLGQLAAFLGSPWAPIRTFMLT
jgi:hypothetical protein